MVFVARGCLRSYVIDEQGRVHILGFAPDDWWLSDSARFLFPSIAAAYRVGLQRLAAAKDKRIISSLSASAHDRYLDFVARYPTLLRRVPLRMLASYLGMTPETLSRIRKRLSTRASAEKR
jgi:hypothetical protein